MEPKIPCPSFGVQFTIVDESLVEDVAEGEVEDRVDAGGEFLWSAMHFATRRRVDTEFCGLIMSIGDR